MKKRKDFYSLEKIVETSRGEKVMEETKNSVKESEQIMKVRKRNIELLHKAVEILGENNVSLENTAREQLQMFLYDWADLENDYDYISETSSYVAKRYAEVWAVLPSLQEIDLLIEQVSKANYTAELFMQETKEERIKKLKKLRSAIKASQTQ